MTTRTVLVAVNDMHVGSPFALCPARWLLPTDKELRPNELQEKILAHWCKCWQDVAALRKGARLVVLVIGDVVEGLHHDSTEVDTPRLDVQEAMAVACLEAGLTLAKFGGRRNATDSIYFVRGTPAHDGNDGASLERVARAILDVDAQDSHQYVLPALQRTVNGVRFDVCHKPGSGPGSRAQTHGNAFGNWLRSLYFAGLEAGSYPRYVLSAHHHNYLRRDVYTLAGHVALTGFILPAWKVKDAYIYQIAPFGITQVGMLAFDITIAGAVTEYDWRIPIEQAEIAEL